VLLLTALLLTECNNCKTLHAIVFLLTSLLVVLALLLVLLVLVLVGCSGLQTKCG
jgi:uncharacterized membrane protein